MAASKIRRGVKRFVGILIASNMEQGDSPSENGLSSREDCVFEAIQCGSRRKMRSSDTAAQLRQPGERRPVRGSQSTESGQSNRQAESSCAVNHAATARLHLLALRPDTSGACATKIDIAAIRFTASGSMQGRSHCLPRPHSPAARSSSRHCCVVKPVCCDWRCCGIMDEYQKLGQYVGFYLLLVHELIK